MAKQLNVSLAFTADTRDAKAQLQDLQKQLNNILKTPSNKLGITDDIREAISATAELSSRLQQATNVNTGNLDFSKFNNSLKQSGQSLSAYGQQLQKLGPAGQQAFLTLTKSVAAAEIPIKRTNALVKEFTTTLANTARWQVSSSVLHGLMGSMQSAYRYAQDLNKSLTDIRIVTGQSADQMARFAQQANSAAKQLSATTLEYTNASLIYYQQGLTDQQVKERTDVTIKMANVTRQSSETVSEQMTAVWNNFYNGSKSLEYYADVMTALGAATASSADEIAGGLEKFAAIGDTIGLSYEYAASALATITSNTRQSEEVVGTALKTIFARIQGLNLGETLEDGVTLNKYSAALQQIGISIFDSSGELKKMDNILDEMGNKWETLTKSQQTALAQTVAGVRQYTQLVALMDNWNKGDADSMQANLNTAYGSSGALQEQADIYAESWEAAQDRVSAAAEKIYSALLNDDFFIDILNGFEKVLTFINQLIDNLGGLKGVLLTLGAIVTKVFSAQMAQGLTNMAYNVKMMTKSGRESVEKERRDFIENAVNTIPQSNEYTTDVEKAQQDSLRTELTLQMEYMDNSERMSAIEAETNKKLIERTKLLREQTVELQKQKENIDTRVSDGVMDLRTDISAFNIENRQTGEALNYDRDIQPEVNNIKAAAAAQAELKDLGTTIELLANKSDKGKAALTEIKKALTGLENSADEDIARLVKEINQLGDSPDPKQLQKKLEALNVELEKTIKISKQNIKDVVSPEAGKKVDALTQDLREQAQAIRDVRVANQEAQQSQEDTSKNIAGATGAQKQWSDIMVESANVAFNVASAISMVSSAIDTLKDPNVSGLQKFVTVLSTVGMVLPTIISLVGTMKKLFSEETLVKIANAAATWSQVAAEKAHNQVQGENDKATRRTIKETIEDTKNKWNETVYNKRKDDFETVRQIKDKDGNMVDVVKNKKTGKVMTEKYAKKDVGKQALKALGSKIASTAIATAGIAVIVGTVAMVVNQMNKAEKAVEKAKAAAQSLSENYDKVKASYDNFANAQSGYETATNNMKELTKGTVAYQEALMQANQAAGELLATNKNLKYTIEDGQIVIDEKSLEQAKAEELRKLETAQAAKMAGQREVNEAEIALNKRDMARDLKSNSDWDQKRQNAKAGGALAGLGAGLTAGALIGGGVFSVPAALIGGLVGLIGGTITGLVAETSTEAENEAIDLLAQQAEKDETFLARLKAGEVSSDELKAIGIKDEGLIASLQKNGEEVAALAGEMQANTAAINAQNDLVAANVLADNETVQNSEYKDQIVDITGDAYGHAYNKAMESDWVDSWGKDGIAQIHGANKEAQKVFDEYLKYAGLEGQGYELTDTTGTDKNRKFVYKDKEGKEQTVSLEVMQAARAAYEASNALDEGASKLAETFANLADSTSQADQALLSFVSDKNFEKANKGEFEAIQNEVGPITQKADGTYRTKNVENYLEKALGEELTDDVAIRYGYESADAMLQAFAKKLSDADEAWNSIEIPDNFKFSNEMSLNTAKALESQIKNMNLGPLGEGAGKEYVEKLNTMLEGVDTEDQQKALEALTQIDWSDWDAMEQADRLMKEYGVDINTASEEWVEFAEKMRIATGARPNFEKLKETLQNISGILKDLNFGDIISEEDYQELIAYNDEWERFFMMQADGTRKFIGDSAAMRQETMDNIRAQKQDLEHRKKIQQGMKDANWSINGKAVDWHETDTFDMIGAAKNLKNASDTGSTGQVLATLGYSDEVIQKMIDDYNKAVRKGDKEAIQQAEERLETMYNGIGDFLEEDLEEMGQELDEMLASTATNLSQLNTLIQQGEISAEAYSKQFEVLAQDAFNSAETLAELDAAMDQFQLNENDELYTQNLIRIAEGYKSCADELANYQIALSNFNAETNQGAAVLEQAEETLRAMISLEEAAKQYSLEVEVLTAQSKRLAEAYGLTEQQAADLAVRNQRMNKGVSELVENWEDWSKELKASDKTTQDYAEAVVDCTAAIADLVGASADLELPDEFFESEENLALIEKAMKGDTKAINQLGAAVAKTTVEALEFNQAFANVIAEMETFQDEPIELNLLNADQFETDKNKVLEGIAAIRDGTMEAGSAMEGDWVAALNRMALVTGMSVEDMNGLLGSMGVQAKVQTTYVKQPMEVPTYTEYVERDSSGIDTNGDGKDDAYGYRRFTVPGEPVTVEGYAAIAQISTEDNPLTAEVTSNTTASGAPAATYSGNRGTVAKSATKNGSNNNKKPEKVKIVDRYKEVNDALNDLTDALEDAGKATDRLYGKSRIDYLKKQNGLIQQEIGLLKQKKSEALSNLSKDKGEIEAAAMDLGVSMSFNGNGNISNYTSVLTDIENQINNKMAMAYSSQGISDNEQDEIDDLKNKAEKLKEAIAQYDETKKLIQDIDNQIDDKFYQWQDNNYEMLTYELELKIKVNEQDLEKIDYYLNKINDNFFKTAEAIALLISPDNNAGINQVDVYTRALDQQRESFMKATAMYQDGQISQAAYAETIESTTEEIYNNLNALNKLKQSMRDYYAETLRASEQEISRFYSLMENTTEVLDHYKSLMTALGKETDYKSIDAILRGQAKTLRDQADAAKETVAIYTDRAEEAFIKYQQALASGNAEDIARYANEYEAAQQAVNNAQNNYLTTVTELANKSKEILENALASHARDLEKALTGGTSFDYVNLQMERAVSLQEEYLTATNQIYETNKLMRTAQQAIDKTTNSIAQKRLRSFINETNQLQNKNKLSKFELDIQQAKYDLLVAELALQEAQNAKNVVRLRRNASGGFSYVYTADTKAVNEAQQQFEDAQNNLYNISLEGANNYIQKTKELQAEWYDTMITMHTDAYRAQFKSEEEWRAAIDKVNEQYYEQLQIYSDLYQIAITTDNRAVTESWSTEFAYMTQDTEKWKNAVDGYVVNVREAFAEWDADMDLLEQETGMSFDSIQQSIKDVTDESKLLRDAMIGENGLISAIDDVLLSVEEQIGWFDQLETSIDTTILLYENLATAIRNASIAQTNLSHSSTNFNVPSTPSISWDRTGAGEDIWAAFGRDGPYSSTDFEANTDSGNGNNNNNQWFMLQSGTLTFGKEVDLNNAVDVTQPSTGAVFWRITNGEWRGHYLSDYDYQALIHSWDIGKPGVHGIYSTYALYQPKDLNGRLVSLDTGGYTGEWGPYGKMAMLHEKELVLNAQDTENLLLTMNVLDNIVKTLNTQSSYAQLSNLAAPMMNNLNNDSLEQNVHIEAVFPNVESQNEIEEAFNNLINQAYQYVNRK